MVLIKHHPNAQILKDCHIVMVLVQQEPYQILQLEIAFEYYHYRNKLNLVRIQERFKNAFNLLQQYKVFDIRDGFCFTNRAAYAKFIETFVYVKHK